MDKYIHENESALFVFEDIEFHKDIFRYTYNKILMNIFDFICEILLESIKSTMKIEQSIDRGQSKHKEIFDKIRNRDVEGAQIAINNHLDQIKEDIERLNAV
jgi:GntR family transcriptional regulator, transcriptional repressor for pyruvate dehydrogenase complex